MSDLKLPDINRTFLAGRLTANPELRYTPGNPGTAVCKLRLAVSRKYRTRDGEAKEKTLFINVTVWDKAAEWVGENLKKGRPVIVEGRLTSDQWEDKQTGQKRTSIEVRADRVQALDWDEDGQRGQTAPRAGRVPEEGEIPF